MKNILWVTIFLGMHCSARHESTHELVAEIRKTRIANKIKKVVLWGHKLHSHTHSYIHNAFYRAFCYLDMPVYWFDNADDIKKFDFTGSLFIVEGSVSQKMPLRDDCYYILHNCEGALHRKALDSGRAICLQVYTHDCVPRIVGTLAPYVVYDQDCLYMPWATDLLPHEVDMQKERLRSTQKEKKVVFIGSVGSGVFGNENEVCAFFDVAKQHKFSLFCTLQTKSVDENIALVQGALLAPAIQGPWQIKNGYIPCRIFKNISYGSLGISNSETVWELFNRSIVYNTDTRQLFFDALERLKAWTYENQCAQMDFVRDHHTYLNRIEALFKFFDYRSEHFLGNK